MSSEVAFLEIRVGAQGATEARNRLKELTEQSERAEKAAQKLAAETEKAEARKAASVAAYAAKADKAATDMAIKAGVYQQKMADDVAKAEARKDAVIEAAARKQEATIQATAAKAERAATAMAINEGKARERMATDAAKYAARVESEARKQENTIRSTGQRQLGEVRKWLMTEEEALRESYLRRRRIIESQATGSNKQMMLAAQDYKYNQQLLTLRGSRLDSSKYAGTGPGMKSPSAFVGGASDAVTALAAGGGIQALTSTLIRFAPAAAAAAASYALVSKAIGESTSYKQAILELSATTGGVENATRAYAALDEMEDKIPISTEEMAKAFSRLVDTGLNPSERSIRALGEISTGTGKSLETVTNAVASATMGNFKGLREFGIRAEESGNKVKMTFRGVTTSVSNDSKSIQAYMTGLGETTFAGSLEKKMNTLQGSVFKLKDAWSDMFRDVGKNNIGPLIKDMVDITIDSLTGLRDLVSGSWASKFFDGMTTGARSFMIEMRTAAGIIAGVLTGDKQRIDAALRMNDERQKALVIEKMSEQNERDFLDALKEQNLELDKQGNIVQKRKDALAEFENSTKPKTRDKGAESQEKKDREEFKRLEKTMADENAVVERAFTDRQKLIDKYAKAGSDTWFRMSAANVDEYTEKMAQTTEGKLKEAHTKEIKELQDFLQDKETAERASYLKRRQFVLDAVKDEDNKAALLEALNENETKRRSERDAEAIKKRRELASRKDDLFTPYQTEIEQIKQAERRKLEAYQEARNEDLINAQEHALLKAKLHRKTESDIVAVDMRNKEMIAANTAAMFGNLAMAAKNMGAEQSDTYRTLFAMSKAFSVAQAVMSIATGTAKALELGWPAGLVAGTQVAAQGAGLLAMITSSNYSGAYDKGGTIPGGRVGLVGENDWELVRGGMVKGPATVIGRQETAQLMGSGGGGEQRITIINAPDTRGAAEFARSSAGEMTYVNSIRRNATAIRQILGVR